MCTKILFSPLVAVLVGLSVSLSTSPARVEAAAAAAAVSAFAVTRPATTVRTTTPQPTARTAILPQHLTSAVAPPVGFDVHPADDNGEGLLASSSSACGGSFSAVVNRRGVLSTAVAIFVVLGVARPADAAKQKEEITPESASAAFRAVRTELEDPSGGVSYLEGRIAADDFAAVMEFTKTYDLEFRKAKMGRARKMLTAKDVKEEALLTCNAVTFDLIGINRNSRPGKENGEEAMNYLGELKADVKKFLAMEGTIDFSAME